MIMLNLYNYQLIFNTNQFQNGFLFYTLTLKIHINILLLYKCTKHYTFVFIIYIIINNKTQKNHELHNKT